MCALGKTANWFRGQAMTDNKTGRDTGTRYTIKKGEDWKEKEGRHKKEKEKEKVGVFKVCLPPQHTCSATLMLYQKPSPQSIIAEGRLAARDL